MKLEIASNGKITGALAGLFALAFAATSGAATLVVDSVTRVNSTPGSPVNLTTQGSIDWAYWAQSAGTYSTPLAPTNDKSGGSAIGNLTNFGGTALAGSNSSTVERYSYSDGTSPGSFAGGSSLGGLVFNSSLGSSAAGKGIQLTVAGDPATERVITLYVGGIGATGTLTLTLQGATQTGVSTTQIFGANVPKQIAAYSIRFKPDSIGDLLTVAYTASAITDPGSGHVGIDAVTLAAIAIPEPAPMALGAIGMLLLFRRRGRASHLPPSAAQRA